MKTLAIIGTAGRREDGPRLTSHHWDRMYAAASKVIEVEGIEALVSGGAAWADHIAVVKGSYANPKIPTKVYLPSNERDIGIMRYYHASFSKLMGYDTYSEVFVANCDHHGGTFHDRNALVAADADIYLAMTFGDGPQVKDGGTAHTVGLMDARGIPGYHLDLNTLRLFKRP